MGGGFGKKLAAIFNVQPGEGRLVGLLLALSFCIGFVRLFIQTAAGTLFLSTFDVVKALPYVYMSVAVAIPALGLVYARLESRLSFPQLLLTNVGGLLAGTLALWLGLLSGAKWAVFGLAIWFDIIWAMTSLALWGLAGRLLNLRQGKRLFGLIGAGDVAAATLGGLLAPLLVEGFGTLSLLIGAMAALAGAFGLVLIIARLLARAFANADEADTDEVRTSAESDQSRRYVRLILILAMISMASFYFIDNIFYGQVEARYTTEAELAGFLGPFWAVVNVLTLINNLFLASFITTRWGIRAALLILPLSTLLTAIVLAVGGLLFALASFIFWAAALNNLLDWIFRETIYKTGSLILYQPLPPARRIRIQTAVEGFGQPIAQGLAGLGLLGLGALGVGVLGLNFVLIGMLTVCLAFTIWLSRDYLAVLMQALAKRKLGSRQIFFNDNASLAILRRGLTDPHSGAALYSLTMLEEIGHPGLADDLAQTLTHPAPEVRGEALAGLERLHPSSALEAVRQRIAAEPVPAVRGLAVRALATLDPANTVPNLKPHLDDSESAVRFGAMVGLLRYGETDGIRLAGEHLDRLAFAAQANDRALAARVIGEAQTQNFESTLLQLLADSDPEARRAAVAAAGKLGRPTFWPAVIAALSDSALHDEAATALVAGGDAGLPSLQNAMTAPGLTHKNHIRLLRVLGRIGGAQSVTLLKAQLQSCDGGIRHEALAALRRCGYRANDLDEAAYVQQAITAEVTEASRTLMALVALGERETEADALLRTALKETLALSRQRLLSLLGCLYDPQTISRVRDSLAQPDKHAYGLEVLDNLVAQDLKRVVLPLLDDLSPAQRLQRLGTDFARPAPDRADRLQDLVATGDDSGAPWVKACALYALAHERPGRNDGDTNEEAATMLSTIEKVLILKTVGIFTGTPDSRLAEIAALLHEMELPAGDRLFAKNDPGQSMYIIVDGRLKVHDGDYVLNYLGERDIVGEMAVLDSTPRMASVTAVEETRLLRLDQDALYELMSDHPEVARGIIHVLSDHLRARVQTIAELNAQLEAQANPLKVGAQNHYAPLND